jgi:NAD dependent epimerase/dehydratase family enzyme
VNLTAPNPVTNRELAAAIGKTLGRRSWLPAPGFAIKLALGKFGSVVLKGQRVVPRKLEEGGFEFEFPGIEAALRDLLISPAG